MHMTTGSLQCLFPNTYFLLKKIGGKALFNLHELKQENSTSCETSLWILKDLKSWQKKKRILAEIWNFILSFLFFFFFLATLEQKVSVLWHYIFSWIIFSLTHMAVNSVLQSINEENCPNSQILSYIILIQMFSYRHAKLKDFTIKIW